ncbi:nitrous oxide reductase accessory protein NosL [Yeosuana marina]|uniref:nitrous oxide reductase accessory protein NosL n=2 Tax=Yeosuana marina TaxID=1565536 RepID=UPI00293BA885|nr:nitrous oxide reductase accessory protein NosL [Yeosuana marina]
MKSAYTLSMFILCLFFNITEAQNTNQCANCHMIIRDDLHKSSAMANNKTLQFDAIECLINYLKAHNGTEFSSLAVTDYESKQLTNARTATYLKSEAIPSPMGANLSAFKSEVSAKQTQKDKGGELYTWEEIRTKFEDSNGEITNHNHHNHYRPDAHAPIGVMGDHLHPKGELMVSLRYMNMIMEGNKTGSDNIGNTSIYNSYMVAPQKMNMNMYMLGIMFSPSERLTIMAVQNFIKKDMDLTALMMMDGMPMLHDFSTTSSVLGDLKIGALYGIFNNHKTSFHLNGSVSVPVGDIENYDDTPMMNDMKLPYAMQLGSGTFDFTIGGTFKQNFSNSSWGTQFLSILRTRTNNEGYRLGNSAQLNIWGAYKLSSNFSVSARFLGISEGKIKGMDPELNPTMVTTANTNNYGSDKIKTFIGFNLAFPQTSSLKDLRFGFEAGAPIYENYNGIQMNEDLTLNFGVKYNVL